VIDWTAVVTIGVAIALGLAIYDLANFALAIAWKLIDRR